VTDRTPGDLTTRVKEAIDPPDVPALPGLVAPAGVRAGPFVFASGRMGTDYRAGLAPEASVEGGLPFTGELPAALETRYIYDKLASVFRAGGASFDTSVKVNQWVATYHSRTEAGDRWTPIDPIPSVHHDHWRESVDPMLNTRNLYIATKRPASVCLPIDRLLSLPAHLEVDMVAFTDDAGWVKEEFSSDLVPKPAAGYAEAIVAGPWIFVSGFSATDYETGLPPSTQPPPWGWYGDKLGLEADYVLDYLKKVLEAAGGIWNDVVKVQVYLNTPEAVRHFPAFEEVWKRYFPKDPPARTVLQSNGNGLKDCWLEIDLIGIRPGMGVRREAVVTANAAPPLGHAPQAMKAGPLVFLSTGFPLDANNRLVGMPNADLPFTDGSIRSQVEQILSNTAAICEAAGGSVEDVVRAHVLFANLNDFEAAMGPWKTAFGGNAPASTFVEVPPIGIVPGARIGMDLWAYIP
jgi:enamine deaminase RidA (YjgF/YER057c/UK114 family)